MPCFVNILSYIKPLFYKKIKQKRLLAIKNLLKDSKSYAKIVIKVPKGECKNALYSIIFKTY